ncbi:hypothetical protein AVEN_253402-1 [Araneus ventricosus]|uniref:Uncharacterized protein n=1 Tax=Araneus ventricosus TaxID=182803 RepID=A0A4Y2L6L6_ARAVE|nr:hypothetical protein AVEN_253402-1 [Araneus ventricosus]
MFISQYPRPDIGHSFCLVVRIFGSEPKGPRFYTATVVTRKNTQHLLSVPLLDGSTKNSIYFYIQQMVAPQLLHQALPNSKSVTHFTAQSLYVPAHTHKMGVYYLRICTQHNYRFLDIQIISNKLGVAPVVHHAATILL